MRGGLSLRMNPSYCSQGKTRLLGFLHHRKLLFVAEEASSRRRWRSRSVIFSFCQAAFGGRFLSTSANDGAGGGVKMRTPVDFSLAIVQPVAPSAQRVGRQRLGGSVFAYAHSAPVHRLHMHRPERLDGTIAHVRADAKSLPAALSQSFLTLFTALPAAQFRLIFRELACSFFASECVKPARERPTIQSMSTAIRPARKATAPPGLDVNRPPLAPGFVPGMF